jgi:eukaryotic-like serine/threonine-protein kinase
MEDYCGQRFGSYRISRLLGCGISAQVYLGQHLYLQRSAAIKVMNDSLEEKDIARFCVEASTIARLEHPHIVPVYDFGVEEHIPYLVMEYAPHGTLRQRHPHGTVVPLPTIVNYVEQIAAALEHVHQHKIIHRDIKPENLLLGRSQGVLLSDFSISVIAHRTNSMTTQDGEGDVAYMAPEQLLRKPHITSDQYALGIVVYEWLTGTLPFQGFPVEIGLQHLQTPPPALRQRASAVTPEVERVVLRALEKNRHRRFPTVQAFAQALREAS